MHWSRMTLYLMASFSALLFMGCGSSLSGDAATAQGAAEQRLETDTRQQFVSSCYDECYQANSWCQQACGATWQQCAAAIELCYDSCSDGNGPALPC
jgi:hypothetical protein